MHLLGRLHGVGIKLVLCGRLREDYSTLLRVKAWFKDFPQDVFCEPECNNGPARVKGEGYGSPRSCMFDIASAGCNYSNYLEQVETKAQSPVAGTAQITHTWVHRSGGDRYLPPVGQL